MNRFDQTTSPNLDKVASSIRTQIVNLHNVLDTIERTHLYEDGYISESLKQSEYELRRIRKFINR